MDNVLGIIGGTVLTETELSEGKEKTIKTPYGEAKVTQGSQLAFLQRHGDGIPPHRINHKANIWALSKITDTVIGVGSVGSLRKGLNPPVIVVPEDYINFNPPTYYDEEIKHVTPGFDEELHKYIVDVATWKRIKIIDRGVYFQTMGPRLETKAEVRLLANYADVVGMTMASEATLSVELGLKYAAICSVDNLAHGLIKQKLEFFDVMDASKRNKSNVEKLLKVIIEDRI